MNININISNPASILNSSGAGGLGDLKSVLSALQKLMGGGGAQGDEGLKALGTLLNQLIKAAKADAAAKGEPSVDDLIKKLKKGTISDSEMGKLAEKLGAPKTLFQAIEGMLAQAVLQGGGGGSSGNGSGSNGGGGGGASNEDKI